ncbi:PIN domain-containing protein [Azospirillum rugosum]|uniref:Nucleic acid-binding protein n=1 Tax=Azospirillum rugosum TaxID=416170 RepID=A0ABS4SHQ6_9PROT|nr:PIN domain-containing protein [Azospirillum rugosum]MBP2292106.1 putative nucleic acid-binding protein [Azospirillum rugosum]MDQ0525758.1 putative nucleic acid-binding protein [Azospirillum rugosum]
MRVSFDTNLLCYAFDHREPTKRALAQSFLERALQADCVLAQQALAEFYAVATRKLSLSSAEARSYVEDFQRSFAVECASQDCLASAMSAHRDHGIQFWDAMLWATVQKAGCDILLSEDGQDSRRLGNVLIVNPFLVTNREILDAALPPVE